MLFSAYSTFYVEKVTRSKGDPTKYHTPHEITISAHFDNKEVTEDCPSAPWH